MVKSGEALSGGAATGGNMGGWAEVANMANERTKEKKESIVSKFKTWQAKRAESAALKSYDKQFEKHDAVKKDYEELSERSGALSLAAAQAREERDAQLDLHAENVAMLTDAKKEASLGNYMKDQGKRVLELLKAGGGVIKNNVRSFWKNNQSIKLKIGDLANSESFMESVNKKIADANQAKKDKEDAEARLAEAKQSIKDRKEARKEQVAAKKAAAQECAESEKELARCNKAAKEAGAEYESCSKELESVKSKYEAIDAKYEAAKDKYYASQDAVEAAVERNKLANEVVELHAQLGKGDVKKMKAELEKRASEVQEKVDEATDLYCSLIGVKGPEDIPAEKMDGLQKMLKLTGCSSEVVAVGKKLEVLNRYEAAKEKQAEYVKESPTVRKSLRGFIAGFFNRRAATVVTDEDEEDER